MIRRTMSSVKSYTNFVKLMQTGSAAVIQMNRPEAFNALNLDMFRQLHDYFKALEYEKDIVIMKGSGKVFCAGGDVKQITSLPVDCVQDGYRNSSRTYDILIKYKKPYIALVDGLAMGGAAIYCTPGKYKVVTERTSFSMPETAIGYFNDSASSFFLSRLEGNFGVYLGMTGAKVKGYDMVKVKLATHYVESSKLDDLEKELVQQKTHEEVAQVLKRFETVPASTKSELDSIIPRIEKCFGAPTVEGIYENLQQDGSDWAKNTIKILNRMSPTSLKVTHRSINRGKNLSLRECLEMEFRLTFNHVTSSRDLKEGCRAVLIEKDNKPKWNPKSLSEVTDEYVESFFKPGDEKLTFERAKSKL